MGKYKKGILGHFRGLIGTVIGSVWNGIKYMKSLPDFGEDNPTPAQLNVRAKFALVNKFFKPLKLLIKVGYQQFNKGVTPMNAATSYHLKNAVTGTSLLNYAIDYTKVILSVGDLLPPSAEVETVLAAQVKFNWLNNAPAGSTNGTDMATVVVYNPVKKLFVAQQGAAARSALTYVLQVPPDFSGDTVHCWVSFVRADGKEVSESAYLGTVPVI